MQKFLMALTLATSFSVSGVAEAGLIMGSESFSIQNIQPDGFADALHTIGSFSNLEFVTTAGTGDFASFAGSVNLGNSPLNTAALSTFSFGNASFGTFVASSGAQTINFFDQSGDIRAFRFLGTFTPGSGFSASLTASPASLIITFNQSGGLGNAISASATLNAPPAFRDVTTPEPTSIAMFGTMCIPLAIGAFRRRQKATQAAL